MVKVTSPDTGCWMVGRCGTWHKSQGFHRMYTLTKCIQVWLHPTLEAREGTTRNSKRDREWLLLGWKKCFWIAYLIFNSFSYTKIPPCSLDFAVGLRSSCVLVPPPPPPPWLCLYLRLITLQFVLWMRSFPYMADCLIDLIQVLTSLR